MTIYQDLGTTYEPRVIGYLNAKADEFLLEHFKMRLSVPIELNGRMVSTLGQFNSQLAEMRKVKTPYGWKTDRNIMVAQSIELSKNMIEVNSTEFVLDVLYHECVHYAFNEIRIDANDNDPTFEYCLQLFGILSNHHESNNSLPFASKKHVYVCTNPECQQVSVASLRWKPKTYVNKFVCSKCHSRFQFRETIVREFPTVHEKGGDLL